MKMLTDAELAVRDRKMFEAGASAMQSHIVAMLMFNGHADVAPKVLGMPLPRMQLPEAMTIRSNEG